MFGSCVQNYVFQNISVWFWSTTNEYCQSRDLLILWEFGNGIWCFKQLDTISSYLIFAGLVLFSWYPPGAMREKDEHGMHIYITRESQLCLMMCMYVAQCKMSWIGINHLMKHVVLTGPKSVLPINVMPLLMISYSNIYCVSLHMVFNMLTIY